MSTVAAARHDHPSQTSTPVIAKMCSRSSNEPKPTSATAHRRAEPLLTRLTLPIRTGPLARSHISAVWKRSVDLLETVTNDPVECRRDVRSRSERAQRILAQNRRHALRRRITLEHAMSRQHLVQRRPERTNRRGHPPAGHGPVRAPCSPPCPSPTPGSVPDRLRAPASVAQRVCAPGQNRGFHRGRRSGRRHSPASNPGARSPCRAPRKSPRDLHCDLDRLANAAGPLVTRRGATHPPAAR